MTFAEDNETTLLPPANPLAEPGRRERLSRLARDWIETLGEDPEREGLLRTPERVSKAWEYITRGYGQDLETVANGAVFESAGSEMVIVKDIEFYSMCEHHMLPFFGRAHVGYIPDGKILGLSKFARITDMFARRLQVQERLTLQVAEAVQSLIAPAGVAVMLEGRHLCMAMRGVEKESSSTVTTAMLGAFREDARTRGEFMDAVQRPLSRR